MGGEGYACPWVVVVVGWWGGARPCGGSTSGSHRRYLKIQRCQYRSMLSQFSTMPWRMG